MKKLATLFTRSLQEFKQVKTVTVLCVMYGGRDIDAQLRKMQGN